ncbi:MAG: hypothetical protein H7Y32_20010 [Chloroflexales bacterium]|nr:hypothetical protein [Chloroflexales bacterium]
MSRLTAGTIVAKRYLAFARVLAQSFQQFHPGIPFFVLLADQPEGCFDPRNEPFHLLTLADLALPGAERLCFRYQQQELSYALTPFLLRYLLDQGFDAAAFFKQESLVLDSLAPILALLDRRAIVLTPHLLAPLSAGDVVRRELNILLSGLYNDGFIGVASQPEARRFLNWWQDRLAEHCRHAVSEGMHYEQRWLDLVPGYFDSVHIVRDPGFNIGHWNLPERQLLFDGERAQIDGQACRFMRFSGFDPDQPQALTRYNAHLSLASIGPATALVTRYHTLLEAAGYQETSAWPYAYGRFDNGVPIPDAARRLYARLGAQHDAFGDPFDSAGRTSFFAWLQQNADLPADPAAPISHLWHDIYQQRADLQAAFPDLAGADRHAFVEWVATRGVHEYAVPAVFIAD